MSFDKFIQTRTIARKTQLVQGQLNAPGTGIFPNYILDSYIDFEADGFLVGIHFMFAQNLSNLDTPALDINSPCGGLVAKVSGDALTIPPGGSITNFSGAQILASHLAFPSSDGSASLEADSRQTTIAYDADSKRIPIKSNDRLGVYVCANGTLSFNNIAYTLTAYFVRS